MRHEKARRLALGGDMGPSGFVVDSRTSAAPGPSRPGIRRKVSEVPPVQTGRAGVLSPLNPKARPGNGSSQSMPPPPAGTSSGSLLPVSLAATGAAALGFGRISPTLARQKVRALSQNKAKP